MDLISKTKRAWRAFKARDETPNTLLSTSSNSVSILPGSPYNRARVNITPGSERTIMISVYNRIAMDVASIDFRHVQEDNEGNFQEEIQSNLNHCLEFQANIDQSGRSMIQDAVLSMFDEGAVALIPIVREDELDKHGNYDIFSIRVGRITYWYPRDVQVEVYNETTGEKERLIVSKDDVAIIENPWYAVMNASNGMVRRLMRKLNMSDVLDDKITSPNLDLIIQLPYTVQGAHKQAQAEKRRNEIETQLRNSELGIAYIDGTEKITQLNRPLENNLQSTIDYYTNMIFSQLSISQKILDGTASEEEMTMYLARTVDPVVTAIKEGMTNAFLTLESIKKKQKIMAYRDVFKIVSPKGLAEMANSLSRNEIASSNDFRSKLGMKPSKDPKANELSNKNMPNNRNEEE